MDGKKNRQQVAVLVHMKARMVYDWGELPAVAVSSDAPLDGTFYYLVPTLRQLAELLTVSGIFCASSHTRSIGLRLYRLARVSARMLSSVCVGGGRKQSRAQGGAAIVGSPRFPPPARPHSARLLTPGATAFGTVRSKEIQGRIDDRGKAPQQKRGVSGKDQ